ncbi:14130_t:CDS:2, partial [Acaulospora morrowiae]
MASVKSKKGPTQAELMVKACSEIINELIKAHESNKDVNLNG